MSKKILNIATFGLAGALIGNKKKSSTAASTASTTAPSTASNRPKPIITQLGSPPSGASLLQARNAAGLTGGSLSGGGILSSKLGS